MAENKRKKKAKKYQLLLMAMNAENMKVAEKQRFYRANNKYILVYTDDVNDMLQRIRYHIIDEKETGHLSDSEKVWLLEANIQIVAEETAKQQDEFIKSFGKRLDRLEKELAIESDKISKDEAAV